MPEELLIRVLMKLHCKLSVGSSIHYTYNPPSHYTGWASTPDFVAQESKKAFRKEKM